MRFGETTSEEIERVAREIVDAAFKVHLKLGPGLLESTYRVVMVYELRKRGLDVKYEVPVPVVYEDVQLDAGYRLDLLVEDSVVVELKAVDKLIPDPRGAAPHLPEAHRSPTRFPDQLQYKADQGRHQAHGALEAHDPLRVLRGFVVTLD
jgi:GxxExxY protein